MSAEQSGLFDYMRHNVDNYHFVFDTPRETGQAETLVILKLPRLKPEFAFIRNQLLLMITYSMVTLLVFSSLMSVLIIRSLNGSILKLEGATRRIAEGDLDFELPARETTNLVPDPQLRQHAQGAQGGIRAQVPVHHGRVT